MRKLAFGALFVGLMAACGGGSNSKKITFNDSAGSGDAGDICNPITQTGCTNGQKCTWIVDQTTPTFIGHVGCAPVMAIAPDTAPAADGAACQRNPAGATGWDDCVAGDFCMSPTSVEQSGGAGLCKKICDLNSTTGCGTTGTCQGYNNLFSTGDTTPPSAGVCDPVCDPFADNNYLGSGGTKTGTICGATKGCYGLPTDFSASTAPLVFSCSDEVNPTRVHRAACTATKAAGDMYPCLETIAGKMYYYSNSCAQGYQPLITDKEGSSNLLCVAMCQAADCYSGHCASGAAGIAPHQCTAADIQVDTSTFQALSGSNNGEQCNFLWNLEFDMAGSFVRSPFSDKLGLCIQRNLYQYGDATMNIGSGTFPQCSTMVTLNGGSAAADGTCTDANGCVGADGIAANFIWGPFACVSATTAGLKANGKATLNIQHHLPMTRLPYSPIRATF